RDPADPGDQVLAGTGAGLHRRRRAGRDHPEGNPPAQEAADRERPQARQPRGVSRALFPGWRPDTDGRERLAALAEALASACPADGPRLQPRRPDQWHATLCFIGHDMDAAATPALLDAFSRVARAMPPHA